MGGTPPNKLAVRRGWSRPLSRSITTYLLLHTRYVYQATSGVYVIGAIEITMIGHLLCTKILWRIFLLNTQTPCTYITHLSLHFFLLNWAIDLQLQMSNCCWQHLSSVNVIITRPGGTVLKLVGTINCKIRQRCKTITMQTNVSYVMEFLSWWVLKSKVFAQKLMVVK